MRVLAIEDYGFLFSIILVKLRRRFKCNGLWRGPSASFAQVFLGLGIFQSVIKPISVDFCMRNIAFYFSVLLSALLFGRFSVVLRMAPAAF